MTRCRLWHQIVADMELVPSEYWYSYTALTLGIILGSLALQCLICKEFRWVHFFSFFTICSVSLQIFWFMEPTESVLAPLLSSHFANLWLWIGNNRSSDQHLNTPFPLLLESKAVGQIWNSCQSLVISNSLQGKLESKHQIGRKMRSVNSGMALHWVRGAKGGLQRGAKITYCSWTNPPLST